MDRGAGWELDDILAHVDAERRSSNCQMLWIRQ